MQKIIIIKYGELTTKKDNINLFISTLNKNIKQKLQNYNITTKFDKGRLFIKGQEEDFGSQNLLRTNKMLMKQHTTF